MRSRRRLAGSVLAICGVMTACSSGGDDSAASDPDGGTSEAAVVGDREPDSTVADEPATSVPADGASTGSTTPNSTNSTTTTSTTSTTTSVPEPEILPVGAVWTSSTVETIGGSRFRGTSLSTVGDELWMTGARWNAPGAWRSPDGVEWTPVTIEGPIDSAAVVVLGVLDRPGGGFLAWGTHSTSCTANDDRGNGYRETGICRRNRPVVFLSDDGTSWRRVDPPSSGSAVFGEVTRVGDGFVAVGTHRGPDWYGMVWSSPDGETWELVRELRGADGPISANEVLWDGDTLVVLAHEHPCSQNDINDNTPGWILGTSWARHLRMYAGPDVQSLDAVDPADHPLLEPPMPVDCAVDEAFDLAKQPYADATGSVIGGRIVLFDFAPLPEPVASDDDESGEDEAEVPRRFVTLDGDAWVEGSSEGVPRVGAEPIDLDGELAFVVGAGRNDLTEMTTYVPNGDGTWSAQEADRQLVGGLLAVGGFRDSVVAVTYLLDDPFSTIRIAGDPFELVASSTRAIAADEVVSCTPAAGEVCRQARFAGVDGYPDLSGADFGGAEVWFAELGSGDYSGVSFAGAQLQGAVSDASANFAGADFSGARLNGSDLQDVAGANFAGADLTDARIGFSDLPVSFDGAVLVDADLDVIRGADGEFATLELSLAGFDLTGTTISGPIGDGEERLVVTDLRGAVLDGTYFYAVDLTGVQVDEGVDWENVNVWDNSLCPDGLPPTDGTIGTCARDA
ncbi:MAG: pentapeptide repeat-containing protein [Ilumatobacteraceae bacterium]|nr:pentapeptide repeat-containing protein [Ilumatobacteraceae bacterium]